MTKDKKQPSLAHNSGGSVNVVSEPYLGIAHAAGGIANPDSHAPASREDNVNLDEDTEKSGAQKGIARKAAGRSTIQEVAEELAEHTGWSLSRWIFTLVGAILDTQTIRRENPREPSTDRDLVAYNPFDLTDRLPYTAQEISNGKYRLREWHEQVDRTDINKWLSAQSDFRVNYRLQIDSPPEMSATKNTSEQSASQSIHQLRIGLEGNTPDELRAYVARRIPEIQQSDPSRYSTVEPIAKELFDEMKRLGYRGKKVELSVSYISRLFPQGATGGRAKNGKKKK